MDEKLLTPVEVAEMLQIKKNTVYDMIKRGDLKASKMGKQFRIAEQDVDRIFFWIPFALCSMSRRFRNTEHIALHWEAITVSMRCIRMTIMWQPVISGTA